ncbi:MAG: Gfo/Idh/MocA family oxidoreductase [Candidatus Moduliflexus flocculans]|nr:Gfo/Idh/MocA family oxidoreductase [Candidatus Moduliflexus flocculans]
MESFLEKPEVQWVAVCDLDKEPLAMAKGMVDKKYGNKACATYHDFRELYARKDLDAVSIAVPDHWHAILSIAALRAGLDVYGEKPLTHNLREGRALCDAVERYGRVWQTGSWQRSVENFHQACELVRNGRIGKVKRIEVGLPSGHYDFAGTFGQEALVAPPANLDYEFWVGPAPWWPYCKARVHMNWRWNMDFGGGQYMDWIGHHLDIAHWGMGWDETGPVEIEATAEYPTSGIYNSPTRYYVKAKYADGTPMVLAGGHDEIWSGTKWIGEYGWIWVDRGQFEAEPSSLKREVVGPEEVRLYQEPRPPSELPRLRPQPGRRRSPRPRRPTARRASGTSASSPWRSGGRSGGTRRPRPSSAIPRRRGSWDTRTASPGSCRSEESDHEKNAYHDRGRGPRRLRIALCRPLPRRDRWTSGPSRAWG